MIDIHTLYAECLATQREIDVSADRFYVRLGGRVWNRAHTAMLTYVNGEVEMGRISDELSVAVTLDCYLDDDRIPAFLLHIEEWSRDATPIE